MYNILSSFVVPALQSLRIGSKPMLDDYLSKQFLERVPKSGFPILTSVANTSASHFQVSSFLTNHCTHFCAALLQQTSKLTLICLSFLQKKDTTNAHPTPLHLSARHCLNKLSRILTECPGAGAAANIRNRLNRTTC